MRREGYAAGFTSISLAILVGSGTVSPNSRRVSRWPEIASRMFRSVSSKVFPVVTQPGRSGTYAAQLVAARSKMTAYFRFMLSPPDPLLSGWISRSFRQLIARMAGNGDHVGFRRVLVMGMAADRKSTRLNSSHLGISY